ncbi:MAG: hypothetical protein FJX71_00130 [Alphaproteobacteria bacterium]|nr:hypothetical protein [Alphaproteobacteria bacterium]
MRRICLFLLGFCFLACTNAHAAIPSTGIIVIVNKDIITVNDVNQRIRLANLSMGKPAMDPIPNEMRKKIIQGMIDECLQLQVAKLKKIVIKDADVERALEDLAKDNKISLSEMLKMLKANGISKQTMMTRLKAQISWARYIREMYGPLVRISDKDVDAALTAAKEEKPEQLPPEYMNITLCQAIFPIKPDSPEEMMMLYGPRIEEVHQIKGCAPFLKAARESGAKVDENRVVRLGQLPDALKEMVQKTKAGTCMQPVMTPDGLVLTMVCSKIMPKAPQQQPLTRDTAFNVVEQRELGKRAAQEMAKLQTAAYIEWKDSDKKAAQKMAKLQTAAFMKQEESGKRPEQELQN